MRTTVTLENDVWSMLEQISHERHISFKTSINAVLREGFEVLRSRTARKTKPVPIKTISLGGLLIDDDCPSNILEKLEMGELRL